MLGATEMTVGVLPPLPMSQKLQMGYASDLGDELEILARGGYTRDRYLAPSGDLPKASARTADAMAGRRQKRKRGFIQL